MWTGASWYLQKGFRWQAGPVSGDNRQ